MQHHLAICSGEALINLQGKRLQYYLRERDKKDNEFCNINFQLVWSVYFGINTKSRMLLIIRYNVECLHVVSVYQFL